MVEHLLCNRRPRIDSFRFIKLQLQLKLCLCIFVVRDHHGTWTFPMNMQGMHKTLGHHDYTLTAQMGRPQG